MGDRNEVGELIGGSDEGDRMGLWRRDRGRKRSRRGVSADG